MPPRRLENEFRQLALIKNKLDSLFDPPLAASGQGVDIVVTLPAGGSGNTNACASARGFLV
ncbi:MAG: hypothetical protein WBW81_13040 [Methylocella sp.]